MSKIVAVIKPVLFFILLITTLLPSAAAAETEPEEVVEGSSSAAEETVTVRFFDDRFCPVCQDAKSFLQSLSEEKEELELEIYPISETELIHQTARELGVDRGEYDPRMAPVIFIGDQVLQFTAFGESQRENIVRAVEGKMVDLSEEKYGFSLPFIDRQITVEDWSLPAITIILGSLDGFNVCSLGALILILSLVMALGSRKLIFLYGGLFILTAVAVYGVLVFVWGQLFEYLLGHLGVMALIVGLAALGGAIYFFKEFWRFYRYGPTCEASESDLARKATLKVKETLKNPASGPLVLAGSVMFFAAVITLVELPCSIGVPIAFSAILAERGVSLAAFTGYVLLYLFFYMLIEVIIFSGAVMTKQIWFAGSRMITWVTFAGALILLYLAWYYLSGLDYSLIIEEVGQLFSLLGR